MSKMLRLTVLILLAIGGSLTACNLDMPRCTELPAPFGRWITTLEYEEYIALGPGETERPLYLKWGYPISDCIPDRFRVVVNDVPVMEEESLFEEIVSPPGVVMVLDSEDYGSYMLYATTTSESFPAGYYWYWVIPMSGDWFHGERGGPFHTYLYGGDCARDDPYIATTPELVYPRNGQTISTLSPTLVWRNRNYIENGCVDYNYQYPIYSQVTDVLSLDLTGFPDDMTPGAGVERATLESLWHSYDRSIALNLSECTRTWWKVIVIAPARGEDYAFYMSIESETFYFDIDPSLCEDELPPLFDLPFAMPVTPLAKTVETANCRSGPTTEYPIRSILPAETEYEIRARNQSGDSWYVYDPVIGYACWVAGDLVEVSGDTSQVPIIEAAPLAPTPTDTPVPVNCSQYNGLTCEADNHPCKWTGNVCVNK